MINQIQNIMNHKILLPLSILFLAACSKNDADLSSDFPIMFSPKVAGWETEDISSS